MKLVRFLCCVLLGLALGSEAAKANRPTRIGVVGAGLAGLTTTYKLRNEPNIVVTLYEANTRLGGRCWSGQMPNGQVFEHGGELIDSWHSDVIDLALELGVSVDLIKANQAISGPQNHITVNPPDALTELADANPDFPSYTRVVDWSKTTDPAAPVYMLYSDADAQRHWTFVDPATGKSARDVVEDHAKKTYPGNFRQEKLKWPLQYKNKALAAQLDSMTIADYINMITTPLCAAEGCTDGRKTPFAQFLRLAYTGEFGAEVEWQSALNLIYLLGYGPHDRFESFGVSDELFHIGKGNDDLVKKMVAAINASPSVTTKTSHKLTKVRRLPNTQYELSFANGVVSTFDRIVLALPFSTYRKTVDVNGNTLFNGDYVDVSQAGFSPLKLYAIENLPMSLNAKLNVQTKQRFWRTANAASAAMPNNGELYCTSDPYNTGLPQSCFQNSWEPSRGTANTQGILNNYQSGLYPMQRPQNFRFVDKATTPKAQYNSYLTSITNSFLASINTMDAGATSSANFAFTTDSAGYINNVYHDFWIGNPYTRGAYSFWAPGQYIAGTGTLPDYTNRQQLQAKQIYEPTPLSNVVAFAGYEGVAEPFNGNNIHDANCHFAGEHTAYDSQGYLNGAVGSGVRVAQEILFAGAGNGVAADTEDTNVLGSSSTVTAVMVAVSVASAFAVAAFVVLRVRRRRAGAIGAPSPAAADDDVIVAGDGSSAAAATTPVTVGSAAAAVSAQDLELAQLNHVSGIYAHVLQQQGPRPPESL